MSKNVESPEQAPVEPTGEGQLSRKEMELRKEQDLLRNAEILRMMPDNIADALAKARSKPIWCSDIRWRMELRRRQSARYGF